MCKFEIDMLKTFEDIQLNMLIFLGFLLILKLCLWIRPRFFAQPGIYRFFDLPYQNNHIEWQKIENKTKSFLSPKKWLDYATFRPLLSQKDRKQL